MVSEVLGKRQALQSFKIIVQRKCMSPIRKVLSPSLLFFNYYA